MSWPFLTTAARCMPKFKSIIFAEMSFGKKSWPKNGRNPFLGFVEEGGNVGHLLCDQIWQNFATLGKN